MSDESGTAFEFDDFRGPSEDAQFVGEMWERLRGEPDLSNWEHDFLRDMVARARTRGSRFALTQRQRSKVEEIADRLIGGWDW